MVCLSCKKATQTLGGDKIKHTYPLKHWNINRNLNPATPTPSFSTFYVVFERFQSRVVAFALSFFLSLLTTRKQRFYAMLRLSCKHLSLCGDWRCMVSCWKPTLVGNSWRMFNRNPKITTWGGLWMMSWKHGATASSALLLACISMSNQYHVITRRFS